MPRTFCLILVLRPPSHVVLDGKSEQLNDFSTPWSQEFAHGVGFCTVHFSGKSLTTGRVDGAGFRNVMKVPSCQCSHLRLRVPASVRPADARLSRGQWYCAVLCVSVCELAELALELDLAACEVVTKSCFCSRICI